MDFCTGDRDHVLYLYRDTLFEKCLEGLRARSGESLAAARKIDEFVDLLLNPGRNMNREKFRFTRNKEARIRHCKKVDLGCGYRLVCIKKDGRLALLYAGTHDECFRWIERNKGMNYDFSASKGIPVCVSGAAGGERVPEDVLAEQRMLDEHESMLMSRIDDEVLRKIFPGLCQKARAGV